MLNNYKQKQYLFCMLGTASKKTLSCVLIKYACEGDGTDRRASPKDLKH